jgi:hypothetical protein
MRSLGSVPALAALLGQETLPAAEAVVSDFALLGEIDRKHPYLQGFAEARFADFTKVHFWRYRQLDLSEVEEVRVLAAFDSGDPAWFEVPVGSGSLLVMTSGWHRQDSQLALSSKFIPLMYSVLTQDPTGRDRKRVYFVGDRIPMEPGEERRVTKPNGDEVELGAEATGFEGTSEPGLYTLAYPDRSVVAAVNLAADESRLAPIEGDRLEQLLKLDAERADEGERGDIPPAKLTIEEQESRQKGWLWLLYLVLILVILEIVYSARCAQPKAAGETG